MKRFFVLTLSVLVAAPANAQAWYSVRTDNDRMIQGSGHIQQQVRPVANIRHVDLRGFANLEVRIGRAPSLVVIADDNLLPQLTSTVNGDTLVLGTVGSMRTQVTPRIVLTMPAIESVRSSGSGNVSVVGVNNGRLTLTGAGSGDFVAQGRASDLALVLHGSGDADLRGLRADHYYVGSYGSGNARLATNGALVAAVYGSGSIFYAGHPQPLAVSEHGSGRVIAADR